MMSMYKTRNATIGGRLIGLCLLLLLIFHSPIVVGQTRVQVSGTVSGEEGDLLSGVSIRVNDGSASTSTDDDGHFTIQSPANSVLVISYLGYTTEEITVGGSDQQVAITLQIEESTLDEVVVVGYGTQRKEAVTGSVASIGGDDMRDVPSANITQAIQGRLPGVQLSQTSTKPGASMQIRIRGTRSLNASNDPLVVLDGIPFTGTIGDINPNDIKSLDILKDASATAIYGSRGANGVILVTTNRGVSGQPARVSYNGFQGLKSIFSKYPMMDGPEFAAMRKAAGLFQNGEDELDDIDTDWQDLFYRTGNFMSHDIGISAGSAHGNYNFGGGYFKEEGVVPTQGYERMSLRATVDQQVGDYFRFGLNTNNNYNVTTGSQVGIYGVLSMSPIASPYNDDGTWKRTIRMPLDEPWNMSREIVEGVQDQWLNEVRAFATYNALYGEVKIPGVEGLKLRTNVGLDYRQNNTGAYTGEGINATNPTTESTASVSNSHTYHWVIENLLTYDRTFAGKHNLNITGLYSAEQNKFVRSSMSARDIPSDAFQFYNLGHAAGELTIDPNGQSYELWGLMSWMGRAMYSYDDRYMITATVRSDGSSRLATGHQWHTYPAISAGWNIGRESFMNDVSFVDQLKLRVGYGQTSNQAINPYATLGRLATRPYNFGDDNYQTGFYVS